MKTKNKLLSLALSVMIMLSTCICLAGCGKKYTPEYAWGKTFTFQGTIQNDKQNYGNDSKNTKLALMTAEYNNHNLKFDSATVCNNTQDLTSICGNNATEFINNLDAIALQKLTEVYQNLTIVIGSKEELSIKIINGSDEKTFKLVNSNLTMYNIEDEAGKQIGSIDVEISRYVINNKANNLYINLYNYFASDSYDCKIIVPTKTPITDGSADKDYAEDGTLTASKITFIYNACFNVKP